MQDGGISANWKWLLVSLKIILTGKLKVEISETGRRGVGEVVPKDIPILTPGI